MEFDDLASIHKTAQRCKAEGIPLAEKALRRFVKTGELPAVQTGTKALLLWENVREFVRKGNNAPVQVSTFGQIRRISER